MNFTKKEIYFTTVTINKWIPVFKDFPETSGIILAAFRYCVEVIGIRIYAFVIMKDHIHFLWQCPASADHTEVVMQFKQYTGRKIIQLIQAIDPSYVDILASDRKDRNSKIWKLETSSLQIKHRDILQQKIAYINNNPVKGDYKTVVEAEEYTLSSAKAYLSETSNFSFLTVWN